MAKHPDPPGAPAWFFPFVDWGKELADQIDRLSLQLTRQSEQLARIEAILASSQGLELDRLLTKVETNTEQIKTIFRPTKKRR